MKSTLFAVLMVAGLITACSSNTTQNDQATPQQPAAVKQEKATLPAPTMNKPFVPSKAMKCKFDTDCVVQDSCQANKCKLTGNECRFRSDCPSPQGTCVANKCEFR